MNGALRRLTFRHCGVATALALGALPACSVQAPTSSPSVPAAYPKSAKMRAAYCARRAEQELARARHGVEVGTVLLLAGSALGTGSMATAMAAWPIEDDDTEETLRAVSMSLAVPAFVAIVLGTYESSNDHFDAADRAARGAIDVVGAAEEKLPSNPDEAMAERRLRDAITRRHFDECLGVEPAYEPKKELLVPLREIVKHLRQEKDEAEKTVTENDASAQPDTPAVQRKIERDRDTAEHARRRYLAACARFAWWATQFEGEPAVKCEGDAPEAAKEPLPEPQKAGAAKTSTTPGSNPAPKGTPEEDSSSK